MQYITKLLGALNVFTLLLNKISSFNQHKPANYLFIINCMITKVPFTLTNLFGDFPMNAFESIDKQKVDQPERPFSSTTSSYQLLECHQNDPEKRFTYKL